MNEAEKEKFIKKLLKNLQLYDDNHKKLEFKYIFQIDNDYINEFVNFLKESGEF